VATLLRDGDSDGFALECDDPASGAALTELYFRLEEGRYVRRFPPGSVTDATFARFEAALPSLLRQTARLEPAPWDDALHETARRLDGAGVDWWLTGSAALAVRGLPVSPRDLDLVVSEADAARTATAFEDALIEPAIAVEEWFCRWWGHRGRRPAGADRLRPGGRRGAERRPLGRPGDPRPAARASTSGVGASRAARPRAADRRVRPLISRTTEAD
jgi:hypothetical protein